MFGTYLNSCCMLLVLFLEPVDPQLRLDLGVLVGLNDFNSMGKFGAFLIKFGLFLFHDRLANVFGGY